MNRSIAFSGFVLLFALGAALWLVWPDDGTAPEVLETPKVVVAASATASSAQEVVETFSSVTPEQEKEAQALAERLAESERLLAAFEARQIKRDRLRGSRVESRYESPSDLVVLRDQAHVTGTLRYEMLDHEAKDRIKESLRAKVFEASAIDIYLMVHDAEMIRATKEDFGDSLPQLTVLGAAWLDDHERRMRVNLHAGCPVDASQGIYAIRRVSEFLGLTRSSDFEELVKAAKSRASIEGESDAQANDRYKKARDNGCLLG